LVIVIGLTLTSTLKIKNAHLVEKDGLKVDLESFGVESGDNKNID
jgi:hypothetical protein